MKFNPGDTVRCIVSGGAPLLNAGGTYTIDHYVGSEVTLVGVPSDGAGRAYGENRFELVKSAIHDTPAINPDLMALVDELTMMYAIAHKHGFTITKD